MIHGVGMHGETPLVAHHMDFDRFSTDGILEPGMVFFVHIMIPDTRTGVMAGIGQTFGISSQGAPEVFSQIPTSLFRR